MCTIIATEHAADARFYSCPIAEINEGATHDLMRIHRLLGIDGVALSDVVDSPTSALLDGLTTIGAEVAAVHKDQRDRAKREASAKARTASARRGR